MTQLHRVLIVDDEAECRMLATEAISSPNIEIHEASHGEEALRILRSTPDFSLIVTDINMPVMDGFTLHSHLQNDRRLCLIPIVVYSSAVISLAEIAKLLGNVHFIDKTDAMDRLSTIVQEILKTAPVSQEP